MVCWKLGLLAALAAGCEAFSEPKLIALSGSELACSGTIEDSLCFNGVSPIRGPQNYEDARVRLTVEYPLRASVRQPFTYVVSLTNKLDAEISVFYEYDALTNHAYQTLSAQNFPGASANGNASYSVSLGAFETKQLSGVVQPLKPYLFTETYSEAFLRFALRSSGYEQPISASLPKFAVRVPFEEGDLCGSEHFPAAYAYTHVSDVQPHTLHFGEYTQSKCCSGVFYPSATCCSNADCSVGSCVDGQCVGSVFEGNRQGRDPAYGFKRTLFVILDDQATGGDLAASCTVNNAAAMAHTRSQTSTREVESYFDQMAAQYLGASSDFIDFGFEYIGPFSAQQLGLSQSAFAGDYWKVIEQACQLSDRLASYHEVITFGRRAAGAYPGHSGKPAVVDEGALGLVHELAHNFGCGHICEGDLCLVEAGLGTSLQWAPAIMAEPSVHGLARANKPLSNLTLQVCRGQMGWVDLDGNGQLDVIDAANAPPPPPPPATLTMVRPQANARMGEEESLSFRLQTLNPTEAPPRLFRLSFTTLQGSESVFVDNDVVNPNFRLSKQDEGNGLHTFIVHALPGATWPTGEGDFQVVVASSVADAQGAPTWYRVVAQRNKVGLERVLQVAPVLDANSLGIIGVNTVTQSFAINHTIQPVGLDLCFWNQQDATSPSELRVEWIHDLINVASIQTATVTNLGESCGVAGYATWHRLRFNAFPFFGVGKYFRVRSASTLQLVTARNNPLAVGQVDAYAEHDLLFRILQ